MSNTTDTLPCGYTAAEWEAARTWDDYLASIAEKRDVWLANWRRATVGPDEADRLAHLPGPRRVLVLTEDWCGDAARSVPVLARALEAAPGVEARYLDPADDTMLRYLTHGGRSIPIAIVHDEYDRELGTWGPRPAPLQALFRTRRRARGAWTNEEEKGAFYQPVMAWYAKDKGRTTLQELLMVLERGGEPR